jgi:hypothetical protein
MRTSAKTRAIIIGLVILVLAIVPAGATSFTLTGGDTCAAVGSTTDIQVKLSDLPQGLSGVNVSYTVSDPSIAVISSITPAGWGMMPQHPPLPSGQAWLKMIDLNQEVNPGAQQVPVSDLAIHSLRQGTTELTVTSARVEDDSGGRYSISPASRTICFGSGNGITPVTTAASPVVTATTAQAAATISPQVPATASGAPTPPPAAVATSPGKSVTIPVTPEAQVTGQIMQKYPPATQQTVTGSRETPRPATTTYSPLAPETALIALIVACLAACRPKKGTRE